MLDQELDQRARQRHVIEHHPLQAKFTDAVRSPGDSFHRNRVLAAQQKIGDRMGRGPQPLFQLVEVHQG